MSDTTYSAPASGLNNSLASSRARHRREDEPSTSPAPGVRTNAPPAPIPAQPPAPRNRQPFGWVALALALIGTVFACIPGIMAIGWLLLPLAFAFAIVGICVEGTRSVALVALCLAAAGSIAGTIVFWTAFSDLMNTYFWDDPFAHEVTSTVDGEVFIPNSSSFDYAGVNELSS